MTPLLRPLGLGEVFDAAFKIFFRRFVPLAIITLIFTAPVQIFGALLSGALLESLADVSTFEPSDEVDFGGFIGALSGVAGIGLLGFLAQQLASAACVYTVAGAYLERDDGWKPAVKTTLQRPVRVIATGVLLALATFGAAILCFFPVLWVASFFAVVIPVLVVENTSITESFGRSKNLVAGRGWHVLAIVVLSVILQWLLQMALTQFFTIVFLAGAGGFAAIAATAVSSVIGSMFTVPFSAALATVIYFDLRVRREGLDLEMIASQIGSPSADGGYVSTHQPGQTFTSQPYPGQPYPGQPYPGQPGQQPMPGQPAPGQPYPGQPQPGQPYAQPGQPYPQPYPQPGQQQPPGQQPQPGQPAQGQPYAQPGQPYPQPGQQPQPGQPYPPPGQQTPPVQPAAPTEWSLPAKPPETPDAPPPRPTFGSPPPPVDPTEGVGGAAPPPEA